MCLSFACLGIGPLSAKTTQAPRCGNASAVRHRTSSIVDDARDPSPVERLLGRALPYAPAVVATFWLARATIKAILAKAGGPAVPLDDAYIHFQYARALAEGRFFAFQAGEGYTSGATSLLWPAMLAPFHLIGFRDTSIVWIAWLYGWVFLALLAIETKRLATGLVDELSAIGAGACVLAFGGYAWFASSGMEVTPLAWCLCVTARLSATWAEREEDRTPRRERMLLGLAIAGPLLRPEGMVASVLVLATLALFPRRAGLTRLLALVALVGPATPPLLNKMLTGHFSTTTTQVKWLALNPYFGGPNFWHGVRSNLDIFFGTLLDGREWSAIFVPQGTRAVALAAIVAIPLAGVRSKRFWRMGLVLTLALAMMLPATYLSFLWNRLRYLWPFTFAWCIGVACLARIVADLLGWLRPRYALAAPILVGVAAGFLGHHLSWSIDDVAQSSYAIHNQQVLLGRWARDHLPPDARIGVNDTGAIAYLSERKVFDVVGLTTPEEARYWVAGPGSRFEHYERLHRARPERLPTHFIVYPHWMACDPVLGRELHRATVLDQTILGGATMVAYEARWDRLHSGEAPERAPVMPLVDELDVSDLESESEHGYDVRIGGGIDTDDMVKWREDDDGNIAMVDAGRERRVRDRFRLAFPTGKAAVLIGRFSSQLGATIEVRIGGRVVDTIGLPPTSWIERWVVLPPQAGPAEVEVVSRDGRTFGSMHYWVYAGATGS